MRTKKILIGIIAITGLLIIFRSIIYKSLVKYEIGGERKPYKLIDEKILSEIDNLSLPSKVSMNEISQIACKLTRKNLSFTFEKVDSNPNSILIHGKANCIGYSSLFNSICSKIIETNNLENKYGTSHLIGKLSILNFDLHKLVDDPFFKDYDFNMLTDHKTGEKNFVDPTVNDYIGTKKVKLKDL